MKPVLIGRNDDLCQCVERSKQDIWNLEGLSQRIQIKRSEMIIHLLVGLHADNHLDIGCAEGYITSKLQSVFPNLLATDVSASYMTVARNRADEAEFFLSSITAIPFVDQSIDSISVLEVLEHLPMDSIKQGIDEIDRVLRVGGTLLISVPFKEDIGFEICPSCGKYRPTNPSWHVHSFDENRIISLLPDGYKVTASLSGPHLPTVSCSRLLGKLPLDIWLPVNNMLGVIAKGPWIILRFQKEY